MARRPTTSALILIAFVSLLVLLTVAVSLSIDLSRFQARVSTQEGQAALQGISNPGQLEAALKQHPSNNILQLMARSTKAVNDTKGAIDRLSAQIEPARISKEPNTPIDVKMPTKLNGVQRDISALLFYRGCSREMKEHRNSLSKESAPVKRTKTFFV